MLPKEQAATSSAATASTASKEATDIVLPFSCPVCGKSFSSAAALKGHFGATGHKPTPAAEGEKPIGERGRPPSYTPTVQETLIPDALAYLKNKLMIYGLSERDANAVVDYMKSFSPDDVFHLKECLEDLGMPRNRLRKFLESWCYDRDIPIDRRLAQELGLIEEPYNWRRTFGYGSYDYPEQDDKRESSKIEEDKHLLFGIGKELGEVKALLRQPAQTVNPTNSEVESLRSEINELRTKLDEERAKRLEERLSSLERKLEEIGKEKSDAVVAGINALKDVLEGYFGMVKGIIERGGGHLQKPTVIEKVGEEGITSMIPPEYIEDEGEEGVK